MDVQNFSQWNKDFIFEASLAVVIPLVPVPAVQDLNKY